MKYLLLTAAILSATPTFAGGPVVIVSEDMTETAPMPRAMTPGEKIGLAVLGLIIIGALAGGGGDAAPGAVACNGGDEAPSDGGC